jgi:hypothetical protein
MKPVTALQATSVTFEHCNRNAWQLHAYYYRTMIQFEGPRTLVTGGTPRTYSSGVSHDDMS